MEIQPRDLPELLAPTGDHSMIKAAIQGGADAIYFGIGTLNMRSNSSRNFQVSDLEEIMAICREARIKGYLALNTVIYNDEIPEMKQIVDSASQAGVDAIIAFDEAVIAQCKKKGIPVHMSTQSNISNIESLRFHSAHADAVVLARELSIEEVKRMAEMVRKEDIFGPSGNLVTLEAFAHGSLCMAVSGKCYLSLHSHKRSANRGACMQNCRERYWVTDSKENEWFIDGKYIMSPKDLCTIDLLDRLVDAGVGIIKIEGRGRSPEYVRKVTGVYRKALDSLGEGSYTREKAKKWKEELREVYNRGFWGGYYLGKGPGEWADPPGSHSSKKKEYLGNVEKYFSQPGVGYFRIRAGELKKDEDVLIIGPTTGVLEFSAKEIRRDDHNVNVVQKGDLVTIPVPEKVRRSDRLYKLVPRKSPG